MNKWVVMLATIIHLLPHPFGVSTVGATALYAGAHEASDKRWLVPLLPLALGLLITGLYHPVVMAFVFLGYSLSTFAGRLFLTKQRSLLRYASAVSGGAIIFFLFSNFSVWLVGYYPASWSGLASCYIAGLPFLGLAMLADAAYCVVLFGTHRALNFSAAPVAAT